MEGLLNDELASALAELPEALRPSVGNWLDRVGPEDADFAARPGALGVLLRVVACSEFAAATLRREWAWFLDQAADLSAPPSIEDLEQFAAMIAASDDPPDTVRKALRGYRHRYLLRVLWREVAGLAELEQTLQDLSRLADRLLAAAAAYAGRQVAERCGRVRDGNGHPVSLVILGMGKLGGWELNFSSDIDLIFLYTEGKESDGERCLSAHEYFARVGRGIVALLDEVTEDGFAFRIDTRLRPFGESGPPVTSFAAFESYLQQHGRGWERYAYVKARIVGPRPSARAARELQEELVRPFVYRRYLDYGVFESLREMHRLITTEVERRDMADNIKLGPGGIREIEFIVQSLQLVRGGSRPELQCRELLVVLPRLAGRHGLGADDCASLAEAYRYLRRVENFIQAIRDRQTHDLPTDPLDRLRLCVAMGCADWESLLDELDRHRREVTRQFEAIAFREKSDEHPDTDAEGVAALWSRGADVAEWAALFDASGVEQSTDVAARVVAFANRPATRQVDAVSRQRLDEFMSALLRLVSVSDEPLVTLERVLAIVEQIQRRSAYLALLNENSQVLERVVRLCGQSAYIAQQIARFPVLLDELLDPRIYTARITRSELEAELDDRLEAAEAADSEERVAVLAQFQRASLFRIAVADFNERLPVMRVSDALTDVAETVLSYALDIAWSDLVGKHGEPHFTIDGERRRAGFGIIAYGKLGGIELSYGSDLDIVFLHDSRGTRQVTSGTRPLDNTVFFARLVRRLIHFLTTQTGSGALYEIDMRLRPDGGKGLLVTSSEAFERYQEDNAWTWEHQALLRARPVAGSAVVAREFERIRAETLTHRVRRDTLRDDVISMRQRMRKELDTSDADGFDLKQGPGGIGDIEFLVQYLVLENAVARPAVIHYPDNVRQLATLAAAECLDTDTAFRLQDIYRRYRLQLHHLTLNEKKPLVPQAEFADEREAVVAAWRAVFGADPP
jgi:glutamate-ammonia-ligase adenylyltransferase